MRRRGQRGEVGERGQRRAVLPQRVGRHEQPGRRRRARRRAASPAGRRRASSVSPSPSSDARGSRRGGPAAARLAVDGRRATSVPSASTSCGVVGAPTSMSLGRPTMTGGRRRRRARLGVGLEHVDDGAQRVLRGVVVAAGDVPVGRLDAELDGPLARGRRIAGHRRASVGASVSGLRGRRRAATTIERGDERRASDAGAADGRVPGSWVEVGVELDDPVAGPLAARARSTAGRSRWR